MAKHQKCRYLSLLGITECLLYWRVNKNSLIYSQYFYHHICQDFSHINKFSTFLDINWISSNSDTNYLCWHRPDRLRAHFHKTATHFRCQSEVPDCHLNFWPISYKLGVPTTLSSVLICCNGSQRSRKHLNIYWYLSVYYKGYYKGHKWTAWWKSTRGKVWNGHECRSFCFHGVGVHHLPSTWMHSPTWKLSKPHCLEFLWRFYYVDTNHWQLVTTSVSGPFPLPRGWRVQLKVTTFQSCLCLSGDQTQFWSCLGTPGTSHFIKIQEDTHQSKDSKGLRSSVPGSRDKDFSLHLNYHRGNTFCLLYKSTWHMWS